MHGHALSLSRWIGDYLAGSPIHLLYRGSATDLLLRALPGAPIPSLSAAAELTGRSFPQANEAIGRLVSAGVLTQINVGKRNRAFEARDIINAFTDLERQLAIRARLYERADGVEAG